MGVLGKTHPIYIDGIYYNGATSPDFPKDMDISEKLAEKITAEANRSIQDFRKDTPRQFSTWHVGAGQSIFNDDDPGNPFKFNESEGINVIEPGKISLLPEFTSLSSITIAAAANNYIKVNDAFGYICYGYYDDDNDKYKIWVEGNGNDFDSNGPNTGGYTVYAVSFCDGNLFAATSNGVYKNGLDNDWSDSVQTSANVYTDMVQYGSALYGIRVSGSTYYLDKISTANPAVVTNMQTTSQEIPQFLFVHKNNLYSVTNVHIYNLNSDGDAMEYYSKLPDGFTPKHAFSYKDTIYITGSESGGAFNEYKTGVIYFYTTDDVGPTKLFDRGVSYGHGYFYHNAFGYQNKLYIVETHDQTYDWYNILIYDLDYGGYSVLHSVSSDSAHRYCYCMHRKDNHIYFRTNPGTYYLKSGGDRRSSGWLTSGMDYRSMPTQDKLYTLAEIICEPLNAGESLCLYRRGDAELILSYTETTTAEFATGTLDNVEADSDSLKLSTTTASSVCDNQDSVTSGSILGSAGRTAFFQSFTSNQKRLKNCRFKLSKVGSPTGNAYAKLYAHTGTFGSSSEPTGASLVTSIALDVSTIPGSYAWVSLSFSTFPQMPNTYYTIVIEYTGGDYSNYVRLHRQLDGAHGGNSGYWNGASWAAESLWDLAFTIYTYDDEFEGNRISGEIDISTGESVEDSDISWNATLSGQTLTVETNLSLDSGASYLGWETIAASDDAIPGITEDTDLTNARLKYRTTLSTTDPVSLPQLDSLTVTLSKSSSFTDAQKAGTSTLNRLINLDDTGASSESANILAESKGIELMAVLKRGTDTTLTPVVNSFGYFFDAIIDQRATFKVVVALNDNGKRMDKIKDSRTGQEMFDSLLTSLAKSNFTFKDYSINDGDTYYVKCTKQLYRGLDEDENGEKIAYLEFEQVI